MRPLEICFIVRSVRHGRVLPRPTQKHSINQVLTFRVLQPNYDIVLWPIPKFDPGLGLRVLQLNCDPILDPITLILTPF
jgi:hypothetical protein